MSPCTLHALVAESRQTLLDSKSLQHKSLRAFIMHINLQYVTWISILEPVCGTQRWQMSLSKNRAVTQNSSGVSYLSPLSRHLEMSLICKLHHLLGIRHTPTPYPANLLPAPAMCLVNVWLKCRGHRAATWWVLANREKVSRRENISESSSDQWSSFHVWSSCSCLTASPRTWHWKYTMQCLICGDVLKKLLHQPWSFVHLAGGHFRRAMAMRTHMNKQPINIWQCGDIPRRLWKHK